MPIFLDANAHLPVHPKALEAFLAFNKSTAGYGHAMSTSLPGRLALSELELARQSIAQNIGASPEQIIFASTCTQACEWGLQILKNQDFSQVYSSTIEHKAVAVKCTNLFGNKDLLPNKHGAISFPPPEPNTAFVCIHVQNELGTIQPIESIQVPFFSDITQTIGKLSFNVSKLPNLKIASFGAHKFGGPHLGILYLQNPAWWQELGPGGQYHHDRPGTPDVGTVIAASVALEEAIRTIPTRFENALRFRDILESSLKDHKIEIIGDQASRIPHTSFINVRNKMGPYIMSQLEGDGIYVGLGSACGSLFSNANPIVSALGRGGHAHDYLRISQWGNYGESEAKFVAKSLAKYLPKS